MEQSRGLTGNNVTTVLMKENGWSLQQTADFIGERCATLMASYLSAKSRLSPSLGPDAARFIDALGYWMMGNLVYVLFLFSLLCKTDACILSWSFETIRYFGPRHLEVKETRFVHLRPASIIDDSDSESESDSE